MEYKTLAVPVVFLDLKDFINLAQDVKNGEPELFDRLTSLSDAKKALFITTGSLFLEIFPIGAEYRRIDNYKLIKRLTNGFILRDIDTIQRLEVMEAVAGHFGVRGCHIPLPLSAIEYGYIHSLGRATLEPSDAEGADPDIALQVMRDCQALMDNVSFFEQLLRENQLPEIDPGGVNLQLRIEATERTREEWRDKSFLDKETDCIIPMRGKMLDLLDQVAPQIKFKGDDLKPGMFDPCLTPEFMRAIPTLNMWSKLFLYLYHKDLTAKVEKNDLLDVTHLSVAVPYCDVVVCDKKMASVLRASKLDTQYNTQVFAKLREAADYLEELVGRPNNQPDEPEE